MRFKLSPIWIFIVCCVIQRELAAAYKTEIAITPAPVEEATTKKSGFFSGIKNWFGGSDTTTALPPVASATARAPTNLPVPAAPGLQNAQKPPPLVIQPAPLQPLGPRPDTPVTSPWDANQNQPPQWPQQPGAVNNQQQPQWPQPGSPGSPQQPGAVNNRQQPQWPQPGSPGSPQQPGAVNNRQQPQRPQPGSPYNNPTFGGNANVPGSPIASGSPTAGGRPNVPGSPASSGSPTLGGAYPAGTTTSTIRPMQPQFSQNVPRPGVGQPHISQSQVTNTNNFPRPGSAQPNLPPGFGPYQPPSHKTQPSGFDLSYGGGVRPVQPAGRPGYQSPVSPNPSMGIPTATSTTTSTTTTTTKPGTLNFDLRGDSEMKDAAKNNFPGLPSPKSPAVKEDFPALPAPKSPTPTPTSPTGATSPSAWNKPLPTPATVLPTPTGTNNPTPKSPTGPTGAGGNRVSFVPNNRPTSTMRPGFQSNTAMNSLATNEEIETLTENLYSKEVNSQLSLITVNPQGKTRSIDSTDEAPLPLLDVDNRALENPNVAKMRLLFNNYEMDTLTNEHVTPNERKEENDFLDAVMATNVMRQAMLFLQNKGIVGPDPKTHRDMVKELWFTQYSRGSGKIGSSGFEHVFVNEVKNGTIIGLHNWVYFFEEEKAGRLDYKGYLKQLDLGNKAKILKVRFTHNGLNKPVNSLFIGTSPELELALYTVCFKLRPDTTCPVSLGNSKFGLVTYSWRYRGKNLIGSAFPEI